MKRFLYFWFLMFTCFQVYSIEIPIDQGEVCGDGFCGTGESSVYCAVDCNVCGDGVCYLAEEDNATCPLDCPLPPPPSCGNAICEFPEENIAGCPADCSVNVNAMKVEKVRRCRNGFPLPCNSTKTRGEYHWWDGENVNKDKQKRTYIQRVSTPPKSQVEHLIFVAAAQQNHLALPHNLGGRDSIVTGQTSGYKDSFGPNSTAGEKNVPSPRAGSYAGLLISNKLVDTGNTLMLQAFDPRFNKGFTVSNKNEIERAYYNWLNDKFIQENLKSILLVGHHRGGCLVWRLAKKFNEEFPEIPLVVQLFNPWCIPWDYEGGLYLSNYEPSLVNNPVGSGQVFKAEVDDYITNKDNIMVFNYIDGKEIWGYSGQIQEAFGIYDPAPVNPTPEYITLDGWYHQLWVNNVSYGIQPRAIDDYIDACSPMNLDCF